MLLLSTRWNLKNTIGLFFRYFLKKSRYFSESTEQVSIGLTCTTSVKWWSRYKLQIQWILAFSFKHYLLQGYRFCCCCFLFFAITIFDNILHYHLNKSLITYVLFNLALEKYRMKYFFKLDDVFVTNIFYAGRKQFSYILRPCIQFWS